MLLLTSDTTFTQFKETLVEAKQNANKVVANLPYINKIGDVIFSPREHEPLLGDPEIDKSYVDLDKTYVPQDDTE